MVIFIKQLSIITPLGLQPNLEKKKQYIFRNESTSNFVYEGTPTTEIRRTP